MKKLNHFFLLSLLAATTHLEAKSPKKSAAQKNAVASGTILKIALEHKLVGRNKIDLLVFDTAIIATLQENFGSAKDKTTLDIHTGEDAKETLEAYKGLDEQTQRQTLCADINDIINLLVANTEADVVSKLDSKVQTRILAFKHLQEQVALNWADKQLFTDATKQVHLKEIQDSIRTEIPVLISRDTVKAYFCNEAAPRKATDCNVK